MKQDPKPKIAAKAAIRLCDKLVSQDTRLADASKVDQERLLTVLKALVKDENSPLMEGNSEASNYLNEFFVLRVLLPTTAEHHIYFEVEPFTDAITGETDDPDLTCVEGGSPEALAQISQTLKDWLDLPHATLPPKLIKAGVFRRDYEVSKSAFYRALEEEPEIISKNSSYPENELEDLARRKGWPKK